MRSISLLPGKGSRRKGEQTDLVLYLIKILLVTINNEPITNIFFQILL